MSKYVAYIYTSIYIYIYKYIYVCVGIIKMESGGRGQGVWVNINRKDSDVKNNLPRNTPGPESFFLIKRLKIINIRLHLYSNKFYYKLSYRI